jgi:hypothetical protein
MQCAASISARFSTRSSPLNELNSTHVALYATKKTAGCFAVQDGMGIAALMHPRCACIRQLAALVHSYSTTGKQRESVHEEEGKCFHLKQDRNLSECADKTNHATMQGETYRSVQHCYAG